MKHKYNTVQRELGTAARLLIGQRIKARRQELGLTQQEVANKLSRFINKAFSGYDANNIGGIESQSPARPSGIGIPTLYALAAALDTEPGTLLPPVKEVMKKAGIKLKKVTVEIWGLTIDD